MSQVSMTKCDGPNCERKKDNDAYGAPAYHRLAIGGSDFEMSFGHVVLDFCCIKCLEDWVETNKKF